MKRQVEIVEMQNTDSRFYALLGPFLGAREVHAALGGPVYDDPGKRWWIALDGERVVGFCGLTEAGGKATLGSAYVVPEARTEGVYAALFDARLKAAKKLGVLLRATVRPDARKPFERAGFTAVRETTNYIVFERPAPARAR